MQNDASPAVLYHLAENAVWQAQLTEPVYTPTDFAREGFVHCSTAEQVPGTARRFYAGREDMIRLTLDAQQLEVVYENLEGGSTLFPHVYAPLPKTVIVQAERLHIDADGQITVLESLSVPGADTNAAP